MYEHYEKASSDGHMAAAAGPRMSTCDRSRSITPGDLQRLVSLSYGRLRGASGGVAV